MEKKSNSFECYTGGSGLFDRLHEMIDDYDVVSFDLFDTFLLRPFLIPTDLFFMLGGSDFFSARTKAENICRKLHGERTTIDMIYSVIDRRYESMMGKEIRLETELTEINPEIKRVYDYALSKGKRIVFVSDMYLPSPVLRSILEKKGITRIDGLYVSCEHGVGKVSGDLFRVMLKDLGVDPDNVIHMGDNIESDLRGAENAGIYTTFYPKIKDSFFEANYFVKSFIDRHDRWNDATIRRFVGALVLAWHLMRCSGEDCSWRRIGCIITAVMSYTYSLYIKRMFSALGKKRILFSMRDSYVLSMASDFLFEGIDCRSFYGNRSVSSEAEKYKNGDKDQRAKECYDHIMHSVGQDNDFLIVEGYSMTKSLQRRLSEFTGKPVDTTYFILVNKKDDHAHPYIHADRIFMFKKAYELYEFCSGSPEPQMMYFENGEKHYSYLSDSKIEKYRGRHYDELVESALSVMRILAKCNVLLRAEDTASYMRHYMEELPLRDVRFFADSRQPGAHDGKDYHVVFWK